jgi:thiol-disulfide isomerase/thioredoxin
LRDAAVLTANTIGKRLAPTWETLGEKFANSKDQILIAKMDANENDIPPAAGFRVQGFPTIKFRAAGASEFIDYEGDRSLESFLEFAETHGKNGAKPDAPAKSAKVAATAAADHHDELCKWSATLRPTNVLTSLWLARIVFNYVGGTQRSGSKDVCVVINCQIVKVDLADEEIIAMKEEFERISEKARSANQLSREVPYNKPKIRLNPCLPSMASLSPCWESMFISSVAA